MTKIHFWILKGRGTFHYLKKDTFLKDAGLKTQNFTNNVPRIRPHWRSFYRDILQVLKVNISYNITAKELNISQLLSSTTSSNLWGQFVSSMMPSLRSLIPLRQHINNDIIKISLETKEMTSGELQRKTFWTLLYLRMISFFLQQHPFRLSICPAPLELTSTATWKRSEVNSSFHR